MRKLLPLTLLTLIFMLCFTGCGQEVPAPVEPDGEFPGTPHAVTGYIVVRGFEWGPGVSKIIAELDTEVDGVVLDDGFSMSTAHWDREAENAYLSDELGNAVKTSSRYVAFDLVTSFDATGSPFEMDMDTEHNIWAAEYIVDASFTATKNDTRFAVRLYADCIENRICPELDRFNLRDSVSGDYVNPLTRKTEQLTLNYAAYEPDTLDSWEKNPLIIWLHGRGEGGTDIEKAILGNEVSALTEPDIQSYFTAGDQVGAYVLVVQTPTYWMDGGDGRESRGDMPSRYTEILMDTILHYLEQNPDADPDRIYIGGASNGGFMTLEMLINYPDFFAAGFPCSTAYASRVYARDHQGNYRTFWGEYVSTRIAYMTEEKAQKLCRTPIWFIAAMTDFIIPAFEYTLPVYQAILQAGADNCWCSMYFGVVGTESSDTFYLGHWSWVYLLNGQIRLVQDPKLIRESSNWFTRGFQPNSEGGSIPVSDEACTYDSIFQWLNAQERDS